MTEEKSSYWRRWEYQYHYHLTQTAEAFILYNRFPKGGHENSIKLWLARVETNIVEWHRLDDMGKLNDD